MFNTAEDVTIPFPDAIKQEYQVYNEAVFANTSLDKCRTISSRNLIQLVA